MATDAVADEATWRIKLGKRPANERIDIGERESFAQVIDEPLVGLDDARCGAGRAFDVRG